MDELYLKTSFFPEISATLHLSIQDGANKLLSGTFQLKSYRLLDYLTGDYISALTVDVNNIH